MTKRKAFLFRKSKKAGTFVLRVILDETKTLDSEWGYDEIHVAGNAFAFVVTLVSCKRDQRKLYRNHTVLTNGVLECSINVAKAYVETLRDGKYHSHGFDAPSMYAIVLV